MPRFRWLATSLLMVLLSSLLPVQAAVAAGTDPEAEAGGSAGVTAAADPTTAAAEALQALGIITGDSRGLRLQDKITRGEMVTILVRAAGKADLAPLSQEAFSFPDVVGHWSRGFVAVAKNMGLASGRPDGKFYPDDYVTHAEVVAFLVKWSGANVPPGEWPFNYLQAGRDAGIIPADVELTPVANVHALRGTAFRLVHEAMRNIRDEAGRSLYQQYHDAEPPTIVLDTVPESVAEETFTLEGTVEDNVEVAAVEVGDLQVPVAADGRFRANLTLTPGANRFTVVARDAVGNVAEETVHITRGNLEPAAIAVASSLELNVGESRVLDIQVLDAAGNPIPNAEISGAVAGGVGTFEPGSRTFTATRGGTGYLELQAGAVTETVTVRVIAPLAKIEITPGDITLPRLTEERFTARGFDSDGRPVAIEPEWSLEPSTGAIFTDNTFAALREGVYTLTAVAGGVEAAVEIRVHGPAADLELAGPDELVASDTAEAEFTVRVVDENGTPVLNHNEPITLASGSGDDVAIEPLGSVEDGLQRFKVRPVAGVALAGVVLDLEASTYDEDGKVLVARKSVEMVPQEAAAIRLEVPEYLAVNTGEETAQIQAYVVDQAGQPMNYGLWDITFEVTGPATFTDGGRRQTATYAGEIDPVPADVTLRPVQGQPGVIQVKATMGGLPAATATIEGVFAQSPQRLEIEPDRTEAPAVTDYAADPWLSYDGEAIAVDLVTTDPNGVPVVGPAEATVTIETPTMADRAEIDVAYVHPLTHQPDTWISLDTLGGVYNVELESGRARLLIRSRGYTGPITLRAAAAGLPQEGRSQLTFTAGPPYQVGFSGPETVYARIGTETITLRAQVMDYYGNPSPAAGRSITFTASDPNALLDGKPRTATVLTDENGEAEVRLTVPGRLGTFSVTASSEGLVEGTAPRTVNVDVRYSVPERIDLQLLDQEGHRRSAVPAGTPVTIRAVVYDSYGARVRDLPASALDLAISRGELADEVGSDTRFTATGDGEYEALIYPGQGPMRIEASINVGGEMVRSYRSLTVQPGPAARVQLVRAANGDITVEAYRPTPFKLQITDEYGNVTYAQTDVIVSFGSLGLASGGYFDVRTSPSSPPVTHGLSLRSSKTIYLLAGGDSDGRFTLTINPDGGLLGDTVTVTIR